MPSRALGAPSDSCIFIYMHRSKAHTEADYNLVTTEFMEEKFDHPIFLFLRPDGTEIDEELRNEHRAYSASQIVNILKKVVWPETGKGISEKDWKKAEESLAKVTEALAAGDLDAAEKAVKPVLRLRTACGARDRGRMLLQEIRARRDMNDAWKEIQERDTEAPEAVGGSVLAGDWFAALRALERLREPSDGVQTFTNRLEREIRERFEVTVADFQLLLHGGTGHHYLEASFRTGLPRVENLLIEFSAISQKNEILESRATFRNVGASSLHQACATLSARALHGNLVKSVRVRLFVGRMLVAEKTGDAAPADWPAPPEKSVMTGPDFFKPGEAFHVSDGLVPEDVQVGRVP